MKKRIFIAFVAVILIILSVLISVNFSAVKKPFRQINVYDFTYITFQHGADKLSYSVSDRERLNNILKNISVTKEDENTPKNTDSDITFTLRNKENEQIIIGFFKNCIKFYNVNDDSKNTSYIIEEDACVELYTFCDEIADSFDPDIELEHPPKLIISCDGESYEALRGTSSWSYGNQHSESCSSHPLTWKENFALIETDSDTVTLDFGTPPEVITYITCFSDDNFSNIYAEGEELFINGNELTLKEGAHIYMINVGWYKKNCGGTATYAFYIKKS